MEKPSRRWALVFALAFGAASLVTVVVLARREIAEQVIRLALARSGFRAVALGVEAIGLHGVELRDVEADGPVAIEIRSLGARWSLPGIARGRIDELRVRGLTLHADVRTTPSAAP